MTIFLKQIVTNKERCILYNINSKRLQGKLNGPPPKVNYQSPKALLYIWHDLKVESPIIKHLDKLAC